MSDIKNSRENIFLGKLELMLSKYDEIDNIVNDIKSMIGSQPNNQRQVDLTLSDYYHILEDDNLSDDAIINIGKKIHDYRLKRRDENSVNELINVYNDYKDKLFHCPLSNRDTFRTAIKECREHLHDDYKYRVLTENDISELNKSDTVVTNKTLIDNDAKKIKNVHDANIIKVLFGRGLSNKEIVEKTGFKDSKVSYYKKMLGYEVRKYKKGD